MDGKTERKLAGFTLLEVMITVAIIAIVSAFSMVSLSQAKLAKEVEGAARQVATAIREAQNYALTGKNITSTTSSRPCMFRVRANGVPDSRSFFVEQLNVGDQRCPTPGATSNDSWSGFQYTLSSGLSVSVSSNADATARAIRFLVPRGEPRANTTELSGAHYVDFSIVKDGVRADVCVYPFGRVEERGVGSTGC